jgi:LuxR family maltose regulon positive regulatory protein
MSGQQAAAAESIIRAERLVGAHTGPLPDGFSSAEASLATLKGTFPWGNVREAYAHALRALELEGPGSQWHAVACWAVAMAHLARGELAEADALFTDVVALATVRGHWLIACATLAYRSVIAGHQGRLEEQAQLAQESGALASYCGLEDSTAGPSMALGMSLTARGRPAEALPVLERGVALARFQGQPLVLLRTLRYLAETLTMLGRHEQAEAVTAEARAVRAGCVDPAMEADTWTSPSHRLRVVGLNGPLTDRELSVLALLASDRSEADIGHELFVSHSTVHSHVKSIYRKLGVSSRTEALRHARSAGLLAPRRSPEAQTASGPARRADLAGGNHLGETSARR